MTPSAGVLVAILLTWGCSTSVEPPADSGGAADARTGRSSSEGVCDGLDGDSDGLIDEGFDLETDSENCGACGTQCGLPNGLGVCAAGACVEAVLLCDDGFLDCDGDPSSGCEATLGTVTECSGCGDDCGRIANADFDCVAGECVKDSDCNPGFEDCDGSPDNGCEVSLTTASDCGGCGVACEPANAGGSCAGEVCTVSSCAPGFADCNEDPADGCEQSLAERDHCVICGSSCDLPGATETCDTGACEITTCDSGLADCDGRASNGCEASLDSRSNCGACRNECEWADGTGSCSTGSCVFDSCLSGFADCDADSALVTAGTGCETVLGTTEDCGSCGDECVFPNGFGTCNGAGLCVLTACEPGFADCDPGAPGCETNTTNDASHCGACGSGCFLSNATAVCAGSACTVDACVGAFGDCDGAPASGCETPTDTIADCGGCGMECVLANAVTNCSGGTCGVQICAPTHLDCDGSPMNGCERPCDLPNATARCGDGTPLCEINTCSRNYGDCDGDPANGCETSLQADPNCGGCGTVCTALGQVCCRGGCRAPPCTPL